VVFLTAVLAVLTEQGDNNMPLSIRDFGLASANGSSLVGSPGTSLLGGFQAGQQMAKNRQLLGLKQQEQQSKLGLRQAKQGLINNLLGGQGTDQDMIDLAKIDPYTANELIKVRQSMGEQDIQRKERDAFEQFGQPPPPSQESKQDTTKKSPTNQQSPSPLEGGKQNQGEVKTPAPENDSLSEQDQIDDEYLKFFNQARQTEQEKIEQIKNAPTIQSRNLLQASFDNQKKANNKRAGEIGSDLLAIKDQNKRNSLIATLSESETNSDIRGMLLKIKGSNREDQDRLLQNVIDKVIPAEKREEIRLKRKELKLKQEQQKLAIKKEKREQNIAFRNRKSTATSSLIQVTGTIKLIDSMLSGNALEGAVGSIQGATPTFFEKSKNFNAKLERLKAKSFLSETKNMKGLGSLTETEGKKLVDAVGTLDVTIGDKNFRAELKRIRNGLLTMKSSLKDEFSDVLKGIKKGQSVQQFKAGDEIPEGRSYKTKNNEVFKIINGVPMLQENK
jgi:hypothetical protein